MHLILRKIFIAGCPDRDCQIIWRSLITVQYPECLPYRLLQAFYILMIPCENNRKFISAEASEKIILQSTAAGLLQALCNSLKCSIAFDMAIGIIDDLK